MNRRNFIAALGALAACKDEDMILNHNLVRGRVKGADGRTRRARMYGIHGQSNAHGNSPNAQLTSPLNAVIPRAWIYYKPNASTDNNTQFSVDNGEWLPLQYAVNNNLTDWLSYYGPELKFAWDMQDYLREDIYIVKFAIGDTALQAEAASGVVGAGGLLDWATTTSVNELYKRSVTDFWLPAMAKLQSYGLVPDPKAILWAQGGRDAFFSTFATNYNANLQALFAKWRLDLNSPNMHMCIEQIPDGNQLNRPYGTTIKSAQQAVGAMANNSIFDTDAFAMQADDAHYADHSELGHAFFLKVKDI